MLLVAHRTPADRATCHRFAGAGADVFEIDVQYVRGRIAVSHYLPFGWTGLLQRDNWRFRWATASSRDPGVEDVADVVPPDCSVLLDMKDKVAERRHRLVRAIGETLEDRARFIVCGPHPDDLERLREAGFATWRTVGTRAELAAVLSGGELGDDAVSIRHTFLDDETLKALHQVAPCVVAWTVNDVGTALRLRGLGVDGITTDRVSVLTELSERET